MTAGRLFVVGIGPGELALLTDQARAALRQAEVVLGYRAYLEQVAELLGRQRLEPFELGEEVARAERAVQLAAEGATVALVSSGDAGVFGMASPVWEAVERRLASGRPVPATEVVPGVTAALAAAALLGAPLGADWAAISLSDLLTPWEVIARRVELAAAADFVLALYNPTSSRRRWQIERARGLILGHRRPETPVGVVRRAFRPDQELLVTNLAGLPDTSIDMTTVLIVGAASTRLVAGRLVTPRGYRPPPAAGPERSVDSPGSP
jgi:precorrin-3B C17-methyltransferase